MTRKRRRRGSGGWDGGVDADGGGERDGVADVGRGDDSGVDDGVTAVAFGKANEPVATRRLWER